MHKLNKAQLIALAEDPNTRETLENLYSWEHDKDVTYSESLQLLTYGTGASMLKGLRDAAVGRTIECLQRWARDYSYVESPVNSEDEFLEALLLRVCSRKAPDSWVDPKTPPLVCLREYPEYVHDRMQAQVPNLTPAMQQALRNYNWATPDRLAGLLDDSGRDWTYIERNLLSHVLQDPGAIQTFTSSDKDTWQDSSESFMPTLIKCIRFPQLAQKVVDLMGTQGLTEREAEAVLAMNMAIELLQEFLEYIKKDLRRYTEKYDNWKVYSEWIGQVVEDKDELLGRLTAWNHSIMSNDEDTFQIISVWEPGKDPKSAYRYYLVKE